MKGDFLQVSHLVECCVDLDRYIHRVCSKYLHTITDIRI